MKMSEALHGVMERHPDRKEVAITPHSSIFFPTLQPDGTPIMVYQGTGLVASMLESMQDCRRLTGKEAVCAFFDSEGEFYDNVTLRALHIIKNGHTKHTAYFEVGGQELEMAADDIYCLSMPTVNEELAEQHLAELQAQSTTVEVTPIGS